MGRSRSMRSPWYHLFVRRIDVDRDAFSVFCILNVPPEFLALFDIAIFLSEAPSVVRARPVPCACDLKTQQKWIRQTPRVFLPPNKL